MLVGFRLGLGRQDCFVFRGWMGVGRSTVLFRLGCRRGSIRTLWCDRLCPHLLQPGSPMVGTFGTIRHLGGLGFELDLIGFSELELAGLLADDA
mgnify:CR=1 FL=1